jgi:hypothetical protein
MILGCAILFFFCLHAFSNTVRQWAFVELVATSLEVPAELMRQHNEVDELAEKARAKSQITEGLLLKPKKSTLKKNAAPAINAESDDEEEEDKDEEGVKKAIVVQFLQSLFSKTKSKAFAQDFYSLTAMAFHENNIKRMKLSEKKRAELVAIMFLVFHLQLTIIGGQILEVMDVSILGIEDNASSTEHVFSHTVIPAKAFYIYIVRFCGALALQLIMVPKISYGMNIIHYVNNHPESFKTGEVIACTAGLMQVFICIIAIALNCYLICTYQYVLNILKHFLSLKVAIFIPNLLLASMTDAGTTVAEVFKEPLPITNHPSTIKWADRSCYNKFMRIVYKLLRGLQISVLYYFMPFYTMFIQSVLVAEQEFD